MDDLRKSGVIERSGLRLEWRSGMNSTLDTKRIDQGRDIGFVSVQKKTSAGYKDFPYDTIFAFAFKAFFPDGVIHAAKK